MCIRDRCKNTVAQARRSETRYSASNIVANCRRCRGFKAFFSTSCSLCLSSVRSATIRFNCVLFFQLPQPAQFDGAQPVVLLLPAVERGFTDAELAADFCYRHSALGLLERKHDL